MLFPPLDTFSYKCRKISSPQHRWGPEFLQGWFLEFHFVTLIGTFFLFLCVRYNLLLRFGHFKTQLHVWALRKNFHCSPQLAVLGFLKPIVFCSILYLPRELKLCHRVVVASIFSLLNYDSQVACLSVTAYIQERLKPIPKKPRTK